MPIEEVGPELNTLARLDISSARVSETGIKGEIVSIDRFGNLVTNIRGDMLPGDPQQRAALTVAISGNTIQGVCRTYADVGIGELVAYVGSSGLMEVGRNRGSARDVLGAGLGHHIEIVFG